MVGVGVGDGGLQFNVDAVLGKEELVVLLEPQPAQTVLVQDGGVTNLVLHSGTVHVHHCSY